VKISTELADALLLIADLDQQIAQQRATLEHLASGEEVQSLRHRLAAASEAYLQSSTVVENLKQTIARGHVDLDSVEKRIAHDEKLLAQTSSAKDAEGIGHELRSLANRKSDLEDAALELMEQLESAEIVLRDRLLEKTVCSEALTQESESLGENVKLAQSKLALLVQQRAAKIAGIPAELGELYEKKASRGIAAARLLHRDCGACRIALTATAFDEVMAAPADALVTCPNCSTILVRW
jgi:predicted  nucleic acid-binding Zn-ribbon protein